MGRRTGERRSIANRKLAAAKSRSAQRKMSYDLSLWWAINQELNRELNRELNQKLNWKLNQELKPMMAWVLFRVRQMVMCVA